MSHESWIGVAIVVAWTTITTGWVNYMHWHQTAARTSHTRIILQPKSNLHASMSNIPKQEMADCHVTLWVWAKHTRTATMWPGPGGKVLALALPRPRPRLLSRPRPWEKSWPRPRLLALAPEVAKSFMRILEAKARPRGQQDWFSRPAL